MSFCFRNTNIGKRHKKTSTGVEVFDENQVA